MVAELCGAGECGPGQERDSASTPIDTHANTAVDYHASRPRSSARHPTHPVRAVFNHTRVRHVSSGALWRVHKPTEQVVAASGVPDSLVIPEQSEQRRGPGLSCSRAAWELQSSSSKRWC